MMYNFAQTACTMSEPAPYKQYRHPYDSDNSKDFETIYKIVRKAEGRWYEDDQVKKLPEISLNHPHFKE